MQDTECELHRALRLPAAHIDIAVPILPSSSKGSALKRPRELMGTSQPTSDTSPTTTEWVTVRSTNRDSADFLPPPPHYSPTMVPEFKPKFLDAPAFVPKTAAYALASSSRCVILRNLGAGSMCSGENRPDTPSTQASTGGQLSLDAPEWHADAFANASGMSQVSSPVSFSNMLCRIILRPGRCLRDTKILRMTTSP